MNLDLDHLEALAKAALSRGQEDCESLNDWLTAEEFMSSMLLHPIDARFAEAARPVAVLTLIAEVRALRRQSLELLGVVIDIEQGGGFDDACLATIKRVMNVLAGKEKA